jgi:hypothetical protein
MRSRKYWLFIITFCLILTTMINPASSGDTSITPISSWTPLKVQVCRLEEKEVNVSTGTTTQSQKEKQTVPEGTNAQSPKEQTVSARIDAISNNQSSIFVRFWCLEKKMFDNITVTSPSSINLLKQFNKGDQVNLYYSGEGKNLDLINISIASFTLYPFTPYLAISFSALACWGAVLWLTGTSNIKGLKGLMIGEDGRFSNSKTQMVVWFFVLISTYITTTVVRVLCSQTADFFGGIAIPQNLLILSGISALTLATAKGIVKNSDAVETQETSIEKATAKVVASETAEKAAKETLLQATKGNIADSATAPAVEVAREAVIVATKTSKEAHKETTSWRNFSHHLLNKAGTSSLDLGDFQMSIITLLAIIVYIGQFVGYLGVITLSKNVSLPDVDSALLASFGLAQTTYLAKKFIDESKKQVS